MPAQAVLAVAAPDHHWDGGLEARVTVQDTGVRRIVTPPTAPRDRGRGEAGVVTPQFYKPRTDQRPAEATTT